MIALVQRVKYASVKVDEKTVSQIKDGFLVLLGVYENDGEKECGILAKKTANLRIFSDENGKMNISPANLLEKGEKCEILTGIPKPRRGIANAAEDKKTWVKRVLSDDIVVNIVFREDKPKFCTGRECILIDDMERNIKEWKDMGGTGIVNLTASKTMEQLRELGIL